MEQVEANKTSLELFRWCFNILQIKMLLWVTVLDCSSN